MGAVYKALMIVLQKYSHAAVNARVLKYLDTAVLAT